MRLRYPLRQTRNGGLMKVSITMKCDNAPFAHGNSGHEVARILRKLAERLEDIAIEDVGDIPLHDFEGGRVGLFQVSQE